MTKKVRSVQSQRNGLSVRTLGEKPYKNVEFDPGFFVAGGLISGSTQ